MVERSPELEAIIKRALDKDKIAPLATPTPSPPSSPTPPPTPSPTPTPKPSSAPTASPERPKNVESAIATQKLKEYEKSPEAAAAFRKDPVRYYAPGAFRGLEQGTIRFGNEMFELGDVASQAMGGPRHGFVSPELREKGRQFAAQPYTMPGQEEGDWAATVAPYAASGVRAVVGLPGIVKEGARLATWEGAWMLAEHLHQNVLSQIGLAGMPTYFTARLLVHGGRKVFDALAGALGKGVTKKELEEVLEKAGVTTTKAGTFIPKTAETGVKRAATQSKFTPKDAPKPTAKETEAGSRKTLETIQQKGPSSGDVAAAKLAKMTGAVHPGEGSLVEELAKRDLQATSKVPPARAPVKGSRPETAAEFKARLRGQPGVRTGVKEPEED